MNVRTLSIKIRTDSIKSKPLSIV